MKLCQKTLLTFFLVLHQICCGYVLKVAEMAFLKIAWQHVKKLVSQLTHSSYFTNRGIWAPVNISPHHYFYVFRLPLSTESAYDLLLSELQLPELQQNPKVMSQKSGGEVGPPPSAVLGSGTILLLLCLFLRCNEDWLWQKKKKCNQCNMCICFFSKQTPEYGRKACQTASLMLSSVKINQTKQLLNMEIMLLQVSQLHHYCECMQSPVCCGVLSHWNVSCISNSESM